jgi:hypothetical protein
VCDSPPHRFPYLCITARWMISLGRVCQSVLVMMANSNLSSIAQKDSRTRLAHGKGVGGRVTFQQPHHIRHLLKHTAIDLHRILSVCALTHGLVFIMSRTRTRSSRACISQIIDSMSTFIVHTNDQSKSTATTLLHQRWEQTTIPTASIRTQIILRTRMLQ